MLKVLAVGNSFSEDATALIELLTDKILVRNLFIGGCSLEKHAELIKSGEKQYEYQHNGAKCLPELVSLTDALAFEDWDYVTIQQSSGNSGDEKTYYPYLSELIDFVKSRSRAEVVFHRTWTYEKHSTHVDFPRYDNSVERMWSSIKTVTDNVCMRENLRIIPSGDVIFKLREHATFDVERGDLSLCRDGYHLSLNYGRLAAACTWIRFFTGDVPKLLNEYAENEIYRLIIDAIIN